MTELHGVVIERLAKALYTRAMEGDGEMFPKRIWPEWDHAHVGVKPLSKSEKDVWREEARLLAGYIEDLLPDAERYRWVGYDEDCDCEVESADDFLTPEAAKRDIDSWVENPRIEHRYTQRWRTHD